MDLEKTSPRAETRGKAEAPPRAGIRNAGLVSFEEAAAACADALQRSTATLACLDPALDLELLAIQRDRATAPQSPIEIRGRLGDRDVRIETDRHLVEELLSHLPDEELLDSLGAADTALLLEHLLTDTMNGLEEVLGVAASLERVGRPPRAAEAAFHFEAVTPAGRYPLAVEIDDPAVMARIADALAPFAAPDGGDAHAPRQLEIVIGPVSLAPEDAEALAPGDQIVLDEARGDQVQGTLNVAGRPLFAITIKGPQATLVSAIDAPSSPTGGLVAIGFVFGRREVSARDLRDLAPGSTLDFAKLGSNVVEIVDGATVIGRGELMRVDGAIGVRITGMNS